MAESSVVHVRRFNRVVTQQVGALNEAFLARGRPLGHSRVLWEIGPSGSDLRELRSRLELDPAYLSRVVRALSAERLVDVKPATEDRRVRVVRLTKTGLAEVAELDRRSDEAAAALLTPLSRRQRDRLVEAMTVVERLLEAAAITITEVDPADPDARFCLDAYFAELADRFDGGFDPNRSLPALDDELRPPLGVLLVARLHGRPVGCAALKLGHAGSAEIKRMWVSRDVRGSGVGRRLLEAIERQARVRSARQLRLETNKSLTEAIGLYRAAGYREVPAFNDEPFAHHWFEKDIASSPTSDLS